MAITTNDQLVAAIAASAPNGNRLNYAKTALAGTFAAGQFVSLWTAPGQPGAGAAAAAATPGAVPTSATAGAPLFTNPAAGNSYLARHFWTSSVPGTVILYDRLVAVGTLSATVSTLQTIASAALTRPDANGVNAEIWIEVSTAIGTTAANLTITYTNQAGVTGHTGVVTPMIVSMPVGGMIQVPLATGDTGVQSVTGVQLSAAMTAGVFNVLILRRVAEFPIPAAFQPYPPQDPTWTGLPQIYNSACLFAVFQIASGTAAPAIPSASLVIAQG